MAGIGEVLIFILRLHARHLQRRGQRQGFKHFALRAEAYLPVRAAGERIRADVEQDVAVCELYGAVHRSPLLRQRQAPALRALRVHARRIENRIVAALRVIVAVQPAIVEQRAVFQRHGALGQIRAIDGMQRRLQRLQLRAVFVEERLAADLLRLRLRPLRVGVLLGRGDEPVSVRTAQDASIARDVAGVVIRVVGDLAVLIARDEVYGVIRVLVLGLGAVHAVVDQRVVGVHLRRVHAERRRRRGARGLLRLLGRNDVLARQQVQVRVVAQQAQLEHHPGIPGLFLERPLGLRAHLGRQDALDADVLQHPGLRDAASVALEHERVERRLARIVVHVALEDGLHVALRGDDAVFDHHVEHLDLFLQRPRVVVSALQL